MTELDTTRVKAQLRGLDRSLDCLDEMLDPLVSNPSTTLATFCESLEPIPKAKLFVTMSYAIDSLLFSYLKTRNVDTKTHTIMNELKRVQAYVTKIKAAEQAQAQAIETDKRAGLDKGAANRFIKHDLADNARLDRERAEKTRSQNERIQHRLAQMSGTQSSDGTVVRAESVKGVHTKFDTELMGQKKINNGEGEASDSLEANAATHTSTTNMVNASTTTPFTPIEIDDDVVTPTDDEKPTSNSNDTTTDQPPQKRKKSKRSERRKRLKATTDAGGE